MSDSSFINHGGKKIYFINFADSDVDIIKKTVDKAKRDIASEPEGSVLTMTNIADIKITPEISNIMKDFTAHNKPYVKAGAVLGITGLKKITFNAVLLFSGRRNLHLFESMDEAKSWLIKQ